MDKRVVLVKGSDRREMVRRALLLLGDELPKKVKNAKKIFIHPNLVSDSNQTASTNVESVRGVVDHISLIRGDTIPIGDASFHDTKRAFKEFNYESLSRSGNIKLIDLNDDATVESFAYDHNFKKQPLGLSKTVAESDFNIVVVPVKMHSYFIVTLSLKTHIIGSQVVGKSPFGIHARWPYIHTGYRQGHMTIADVYQELPAQLAIIDATAAMEGNGPSSGREINCEWVLASFNPIAADSVATYLMGIDPRNIGYLSMLNEKGMGPIDVNHIEVIGENLKSLRRNLKRPDSYSEVINWR